MAIVQKNSYTPGQNLTNLALNVDANRLGDDKTSITVNYGTTPATVTVAVGSVIEANGNLYTIESAAESFQMANAAHNYLTFDGTTFSSAATIGTYSAAKQGYYSGTTRTLKWYVDQTGETSLIMADSFNSNGVLTAEKFDKITVKLSANQTATGVIQFDTPVYDALSRWDSINYRFTIVESGWYYCSVNVGYTYVASTYMSYGLYIKLNGATVAGITDQHAASASKAASNASLSALIYGVKDDYVDFTTTHNTGFVAAASLASIFRIL